MTRVKEMSRTAGATPFRLAGPVPGFRSFEEVIGVGNKVSYVAIDDSSGQFEEGIATIHTAGLMTRDTVQRSSNGNQRVNFPLGPMVAVGKLDDAGKLRLAGDEDHGVMAEHVYRERDGI